MWSVGCIFYEMLAYRPLFLGAEEIDMIKIIFSFLGTPNDQIWPGFSSLPNASLVQSIEHYPPPSDMRTSFGLEQDQLDD
jgi:cell division cycle 2-like protein